MPEETKLNEHGSFHSIALANYLVEKTKDIEEIDNRSKLLLQEKEGKEFVKEFSSLVMGPLSFASPMVSIPALKRVTSEVSQDSVDSIRKEIERIVGEIKTLEEKRNRICREIAAAKEGRISLRSIARSDSLPDALLAEIKKDVTILHRSIEQNLVDLITAVNHFVFHATEKEKRETFKTALHSPISVGLDQQYEAHPVLYAARHGALEVLTYYVNKVVSQKDSEQLLIDLVSDKGRNILHYAAMGGHLNILKWVNDNHPSKFSELINKKDKKGRTPLHIAAKFGCSDVVKWIAQEAPSTAWEMDQDGYWPVTLASTRSVLDQTHKRGTLSTVTTLVDFMNERRVKPPQSMEEKALPEKEKIKRALQAMGRNLVHGLEVTVDGLTYSLAWVHNSYDKKGIRCLALMPKEESHGTIKIVFLGMEDDHSTAVVEVDRERKRKIEEDILKEIKGIAAERPVEYMGYGVGEGDAKFSSIGKAKEEEATEKKPSYEELVEQVKKYKREESSFKKEGDYSIAEYIYHFLPYRIPLFKAGDEIPILRDGELVKYRIYPMARFNGIVAAVLIPAEGKGKVEVIFRGTACLASIARDLDARGPGFTTLKEKFKAMVEIFFRELEKYAKETGDTEITLSLGGHSLGGADAQIFLVLLMAELHSRKSKGATCIKTINLHTLNAPGISKKIADDGLKYLKQLRNIQFNAYYHRVEYDVVQMVGGDAHLFGDADSESAYVQVLKFKKSAWCLSELRRGVYKPHQDFQFEYEEESKTNNQSNPLDKDCYELMDNKSAEGRAKLFSEFYYIEGRLIQYIKSLMHDQVKTRLCQDEGCYGLSSKSSGSCFFSPVPLASFVEEPAFRHISFESGSSSPFRGKVEEANAFISKLKDKANQSSSTPLWSTGLRSSSSFPQMLVNKKPEAKRLDVVKANPSTSGFFSASTLELMLEFAALGVLGGGATYFLGSSDVWLKSMGLGGGVGVLVSLMLVCCCSSSQRHNEQYAHAAAAM